MLDHCPSWLYKKNVYCIFDVYTFRFFTILRLTYHENDDVYILNVEDNYYC